MENRRSYTTAEVARDAGVHRDTLLRWLREGRIDEPGRDEHGWRSFSAAQRAGVLSRSPSSSKAAARSQSLAGRLSSVDWGFTAAKTDYVTHGIHPYPAKFIPQIPNVLIQELSAVGETVADPFCGSGTTLVEGLMLKRNVVGVDAGPLACLISRAKTARLEQSDLDFLASISVRATHLADEIAPELQQSLFEGSKFVSKAWRPTSDSLDFWFESHIVEELAEALASCREAPSRAAEDVALASFSSIVVNVSKQDSDTRYVRREKHIRPGDALRRFARAVDSARRELIVLSDVLEERFSCRVVCADVRTGPEIGLIDLVVTSPPYPNAYSYHLYHMTRMMWLEMDHAGFKLAEIGSHRKYSAKGSKRATVATFQAEMEQVFAWLANSLRPGGYACFVIGDSTLQGKRIDNASLLSAAAAKSGFAEVARLERELLARHKAFNPAIGKIKTEHVLVLQRAESH